VARNMVEIAQDRGMHGFAPSAGDAEIAARRANLCSFLEHAPSIAFGLGEVGRPTMRQISFNRRRLLKGAAATGFAAAHLLPPAGLAQAKTQTVNLQLGWLAGNNQIGEIAAKYMGFFEEEKLNIAIQPGGPSIDGVAIVASGRHEIGQVSSSPSLML